MTEWANGGWDEHPEEEMLSAYYDDVVTPALRARLAAHLAVCDRCRAILHDYAALGQAMRRLEVAPPRTLHADLYARLEGGRRRPSIWSRLATAAAVTSLALLAYALFLWRPPEPAAVAMAYPRRDATAVPVDTVVQIVYSADVDRAAVEQAVQIDPPVPVNKTWHGNTLVLEPQEPLKPDTPYSVRAPAVAPVKSAPLPVVPALPPLPLLQPAAQATPVASAAPAAPPAATEATAATAAPAVAAAPVKESAASPTPPVITHFRTAPVAVAAAKPTAVKPPAGPSPQPTPVSVAAARTEATPPAETPASPAAAAASTAATKSGASSGKEPARGFGLLYKQQEIASALGRPSGDESRVSLLEQRFERGWLLWRADQPKGEERTYYVLTDDGKWRAYADDGSEAADSATPAPGVPEGKTAPNRTLGKLWQQREEVRQALGWAVEAERQLNGAAQPFAKGTMLGHERKEIYILYADGHWQQLPDPWVEPTATPTPTSPASHTPTPGPTGTKAPTPLPDAGAVTGGRGCRIVPQNRFAELYAGSEALRGRLACALDPEAPVQLVAQPFEKGVMLARADKGLVYVLLADGTWSAYSDSYEADDAAADEPPPAGLLAPDGKLGAIWGGHAEVRRGLGWATSAAVESSGSAETFAGGNLLTSGNGPIIAIYADGHWERFGDAEPSATPPAE